MPSTATQPDAYVLQGTSDTAIALSAGAANAAGQPTKRFVKDLIRVGKFTGGGGSHQAFEVTRDEHDPANGKFSLAHFREQYSAMRLAGIDVPTPNGHTNDAEANRGYVRDMFVEGDTLYGVIEAIGSDAIQLMSRAKVSINVPTQLKGGNGKTYDYPIDHVAIVTNPVIPDQRGFTAIAASHNTTDKGQALVLAPESQTMDDPNKTTTTTAEKITDIATLAEKLGMTAEEGQDLGEAIVASYTAIKAERDELKKKLEMTPAATDADVVVSASIDPNVAGIMVENAEMKLSKLVDDGKITAAVRDAIKASFVGTADKPQALSLSAGKNGSPSIIAKLTDILSKNDPVQLGEKTKSQNAIVASREFSEDDAKIVKQMIGSGNESSVAI